jgi:glycerol-1-phosphate dehydrogenase [NAD(P)+]
MTVLDGETSPSSGSEHILSHFFDFQHDIFDLPKNLHGAQVGVGTIIMSAAFEILREMKSLDFNLDNIERRRLSQAAVNLDHRRVFGDHGKIFDLVVAEKRIREVDYRKYIGGIINAWEEIWSEIDPYLMPTKSLRQALEESGGATKLSDINRSAEDAVQALLYGSHYRPRYTILDLYWELGLFPVLAQEILERAGVLD